MELAQNVLLSYFCRDLPMQSIIIFVALRIQSHDTNILLKENPLPEKLKMSMSTVPEMQSLDFDPKYIYLPLSYFSIWILLDRTIILRSWKS